MKHLINALLIFTAPCCAMNENEKPKKSRILLTIDNIKANQVAFLDKETIIVNDPHKECALFDAITGNEIRSIEHARKPAYLIENPSTHTFALYDKQYTDLHDKNSQCNITSGGIWFSFLPGNDEYIVLNKDAGKYRIQIFANNFGMPLWYATPITLITAHPMDRNQWYFAQSNGIITKNQYAHDTFLKNIMKITIPECNNLYFCQYNSIGTHLITANEQSGVYILKDKESSGNYLPTTERIKSVAISPTQDIIATLLQRNNIIQLWDINTLECITTLPTLTNDSPPHIYDIYQQLIHFSPYGKTLLVSANNACYEIALPSIATINLTSRKKLLFLYTLLRQGNFYLDHCNKLPYDVVQLLIYYTYATLHY